jgi:hypothetical protein
MSTTNIKLDTGNKKEIGPDGVLQIYPTLMTQGTPGTTFFMNMSLDEPAEDPCFSYDGINMHPKHEDPVKARREVKSNVTYYTANATTIKYHSKAPDGKSLRLGIYASLGSKGKKQKYTWDDEPDFLYDEKGIRNHEMTGFIRLHGELPPVHGKDIHKALAMKVCGGKEDAGRSVIETCYPINSEDTVRAHWDYEHFPYILVDKEDAGGPVKQFFDGDYCQDNKWIGLKHVHIVSDDKEQSTNRLYVDTDPFDSDGKPRNNWKLKAEWIDKGTEKTGEDDNGDEVGYDGIPCTWRSQVDKIRIDGWKQVDFTLLSIREIDPHAQSSI